MCPSPVTHEDLPQAHSYTRAFPKECSNRSRHRIIVVFGPRATILPPVTTGMSFPVWCLSLSPCIIEIALKLKRV